MATIEFKNQETRQYCESFLQPTEEQKKLRRMLYLVKSGLVWEAV
jgi:hypothetical protein